jgi:RNA polymerase sigma-70 factor (ECF subfamily)
MNGGDEVGDVQLLSQARAGNSHAFGELYELYAPRVFRFLFAHLDNRLDAEDLLAEVFLRAWRSLPAYQERGLPFAAFLFRIARNLLIDYYRQSGHARGQVSIEDLNLQDTDLTPGEKVSAGLERSELREHLAQLRDDYRSVLVLRFLAELSPEETAQVMGRSPGAVRVLQHRALAALRVIMEDSAG